MNKDNKRHTNHPRLTFLLGAGVSIPAGMPSTLDITSLVIQGSGVMKHTDNTYYLGDPDPIGITVSHLHSRVLPFLTSLAETEIWGGKKPPDYEQLYYVISQLDGFLMGGDGEQSNNPVVALLVRKLDARMTELCAVDEANFSSWQHHELTNQTVHYIQDVVWRLLVSAKLQKLDYLSLFLDAARNSGSPGIDIFTLNHDLTLEQALENEKIEFSDGFGNPENNIQPWEPELLDDRESRVRLYKLHGSITWFDFSPRPNVPPVGKIPSNQSPWDLIFMDENGKPHYPLEGRPAILAGSDNKMTSYLVGYWADLFFRFRQELHRAETLVVCGYSFRDRGINSQVSEWMNTSQTTRLIVIDTNSEEELVQHCGGGGIYFSWYSWRDKGRLAYIQKDIQELSWDELRGYL